MSAYCVDQLADLAAQLVGFGWMLTVVVTLMRRGWYCAICCRQIARMSRAASQALMPLDDARRARSRGASAGASPDADAALEQSSFR